ncbi:(ABC) transporter [Perkinsus olseni]|uniref:(ABC) transporter n=1 Tax=Perkinsus olseni TaxID=32597 RepID=A0A7J6RAS4_PEROL|nr:(ABC) transporter [Perkinsus olseni]KAF4728621.1 (ABC) transporter [Perkinsus olseni]
MVSYFDLYRYATRQELLAIGLATLCALAHGTALPLFAFVFGDSINDLAQPGGDIVQAVSRQCLYMVYIGIAAWVLSCAWHSIFTATSSLQATRLKIRYFEAGNDN